MNDKYKVSLPHNWPNNELIGDKGIYTPPKNIAEIPKRKKNTKATIGGLRIKISNNTFHLIHDVEIQNFGSQRFFYL